MSMWNSLHECLTLLLPFRTQSSHSAVLAFRLNSNFLKLSVNFCQYGGESLTPASLSLDFSHLSEESPLWSYVWHISPLSTSHLLVIFPFRLAPSPFSRFHSVRHKRWCLQWLFNRGWKMSPLCRPTPQTNGKHLVWSERSTSRAHTCTWKHVFTLLNLAKNSQWLWLFCNHIEGINYVQASQTLPLIAYLRPPMIVCVCALYTLNQQQLQKGLAQHESSKHTYTQIKWIKCSREEISCTLGF